MTLEIEKSIIQVFSDHLGYSYTVPWSISSKSHSTGSGFCINITDHTRDKYKSAANQNKYIITNAHCVSNSTHITLRKRGTSRIYKAIIIGIVYECDLAILTIDGEFYEANSNKDSNKDKDKSKSKGHKIVNEFYDDIIPLELGGMPNKLEKVYVFGYPLGGYNISVTKGIVNRIQNISYYDVVNGIAIQIDAPINPGNSGGPTLNSKNQIVGVAFAGEDSPNIQNMGYIIPVILIQYVINTLKYQYTGLCNLGVDTQHLNNPILREYFKLDGYQGILVNYVEPLSSGFNILQKDDVIMNIDGIAVYNDGTIRLNDLLEKIMIKSQTNIASDEIVSYNSIISLKKPGDIVTLDIHRKHKAMQLTIKVNPIHFLVPVLEYQLLPSYYIIAGLIFVPLTIMLVNEKRQNNEYVSNLVSVLNDTKPTHPDEQIIVLSQILYTELTDDYPEDNMILDTINDIKVINISNMHNILEKNKAEYLTFAFRDSHKKIIIRNHGVKQITDEIMQQNIGDIPAYKF